jgi:hypothetical protein
VTSPGEFVFNTAVDDELYDELSQLAGETVVFAAVWEDSIADALADQSASPQSASPQTSSPTGDEAVTFDIDLYLAGGVYFELYGVSLFEDTESEPVRGVEAAESHLHELVRAGVVLGDIAVDEDDALVLVLARGNDPALYLDIGGFVLEEWDELPV